MYTAKLTSEGRLILPAPVLKNLGVGDGGQVVFIESNTTMLF